MMKTSIVAMSFTRSGLNNRNKPQKVKFGKTICVLYLGLHCENFTVEILKNV